LIAKDWVKHKRTYSVFFFSRVCSHHISTVIITS